MGDLQETDKKFNALVKAIGSSSLLHAALPLAATALVLAQKRWPEVNEIIAGALLLMTSFGKAVLPIMEFFRKNSDKTPPSGQ